MSKKALKMAWVNVMAPCMSAYAGVFCVMSVTLMVAEPTWKTWVGWGTILIVPVIVFIVAYIKAKADN